MTDRRLFSLHDFQTGLGFFDRIGHARFKFCLMTLGSKGSAPDEVAFSFFSRTMADFADKRRHFKLSRSAIARINPETLSVPVFRVEQDAILATKLYEVAGAGVRPLSWLSLKQNVFSSSNDTDLSQFEAVMPGDEGSVAIYRGAMFHQYDHSFATNVAGDFTQTLDTGRSVDLVMRSDKYVEQGYYQDRIASKGIRASYHLAIRRIARPTDERTMIAAMLPAVGVDDTASILVVRGSLEAECCLLANLNSLVFDYACTQKIGGTDIRKHNFSQLPILGPSLYSASAIAFVIPRVRELTFTTHSLTAFARDLGYEGPPYAWNEHRRAELQAELDAWYASAYGLTRDELRYILDPVDPLGDDYPSETFRVLKNNEIRKFGDYRTRRFVLEAWDRMEAGDLK